MKINKRSSIICALIILGIMYSTTSEPAEESVRATQSEMGRIVVLADDWPISDSYWSPSASIFTLNTFGWLTEGSPGKRILKDSLSGIKPAHNNMVDTLQTNGYTVAIMDTTSWTPALLETYDVVVIEVGSINNTLLTEYVTGGGGVFLIGGHFGTELLFNEFLLNFGMSLKEPVDLGPGTFTNFVPHPVTTGVSSLGIWDPTPIEVQTSDPEILSTWGSWNMLVACSKVEAPTIKVVSPNGEEVWQDMQNISWTATDPQGDPLTYTVYYSSNGGQIWTQIATGLTESSYLWDTTTEVDGTNYLIKVEASDGTYTGMDVSNGPFEIANEAPNTAPTILVIQPNGGEYLQETHTIMWTATDSQANPLTYTVYYSSNGGQTWTLLATGLTASSYLWDTTTVMNGANYLIRVEASDDTFIGVDLSNTPFEIANEAPNTAPTVRVLRPNGGERVRGMYEIQWSATDLDGDTLTYTISYSPNGGDNWTHFASEVTGTSYQWDTSGVQVSENYLIKIEASDGRLTAEDCSDYKFAVEREAPTETRSEAFFVPSFRIVEVLGAILVLLGLDKRLRRRKMFWDG